MRWGKIVYAVALKMVDVAQLVRAPVCGTGGRGFESHLPPHKFYPSKYCMLKQKYIGL